jgi:hypothetical protein
MTRRRRRRQTVRQLLLELALIGIAVLGLTLYMRSSLPQALGQWMADRWIEAGATPAASASPSESNRGPLADRAGLAATIEE